MKEIIERIIKEANVARLDSDRIEIQWNDLDNMSVVDLSRPSSDQ